MKNNLLIAVTGGIGSGKSQVIAILNQLGEKTLSCDAITNELYSDKKVIKQLGKMFPSARRGFFVKTIDKQTIANTVFNNPQKLKQLTDYLTPIVLETCVQRAKQTGGRVFVEVPLLFEQNATDSFDKVLVVTRNLDARIQSVINRSNLTKEQVLQRINAQFDYDNADLSCHTIIANNGSLDNLKQSIQNFVESL